MEQSLISYLMTNCEDFWDKKDNIYHLYNSNKWNLVDRLMTLLNVCLYNNFDYDITCRKIIDNIYAISIAAVTYTEGKKPEVETILFTAKDC